MDPRTIEKPKIDPALWMRFCLVLVLLAMFAYSIATGGSTLDDALIGFVGLGLGWFYASNKGSSDKTDKLTGGPQL